MMSVDAKEWVLHPETEYRFELDPGTSIAIKVRTPYLSLRYVLRICLQVIRGLAEIFGSEIVEGKTYVFGQECKAAVFTWQGCTIEMSVSTTRFWL
jgi:polyribonucleotide 5'-hydroxyl-kinase